ARCVQYMLQLFFLFESDPQKKKKKKKKKKKSIYACILINKISKKKYLCMYIDKQNQLKKKKELFFSILACNTSNTHWLIYSLSQHLTRLANDFPAFFA